MSFWTWAKALEDSFDASSRRNLREFIGLTDEYDDCEEQNDDEQVPGSKTTSKNLDPDRIRLGITSAGLKGASTVKRPCMSRADSVVTMVEVQDQPEMFYYMARNKEDGAYEKSPEARRELVRTATCAVFHNTSAAKGVPHSFVGEA